MKTVILGLMIPFFRNGAWLRLRVFYAEVSR